MFVSILIRNNNWFNIISVFFMMHITKNYRIVKIKSIFDFEIMFYLQKVLLSPLKISDVFINKFLISLGSFLWDFIYNRCNIIFVLLIMSLIVLKVFVILNIKFVWI